MKENVKLIIGSVIFYIALIFISVYFLLIPGINKINTVRNYKELTYEEKTKLIDEINTKYTNLENEVNDKYIKLINEVNEEYDPLIEEINNKYTEEENNIEAKYKTKENEITKKINDAKVRETKEFFKNGLSAKYYSIGEEIESLNDEKYKLTEEKKDELNKLNETKQNKTNPYITKKTSAIRNHELNKKSELNLLNTNKNKEINKIDNQKRTNTVNKSIGILLIILSIILIIIPIIFIIKTYNKLTKLNNNVNSKWSDIDVLLKQRSDLIPNIVDSIKGYSHHEKNTLTSVIEAREKVMKASNKKEEIDSNKHLEEALNNIFLLNEKYPDLKSDKSYNKLIDNLKEIEDNISITRKEYNNSVLKYMNNIEVFPSNIVASLFNFKEEYYFKTKEEEKENVKVKF